MLKLVDVSYGGENGFNQAIELSAEVLSNVKFIQEKKLIGRYFDEISQVSVRHTHLLLQYNGILSSLIYETLW